MGKFLRDPLLHMDDNGKTMTLMEDLIYLDDIGRLWVASKGLETDGASIPRFMWRVIGSPFTGKYRRAAIIHDAYYQDPEGRTRKDIDKMFYEAMRSDGVIWLKAQAMYRAVRWFGSENFISR